MFVSAQPPSRFLAPLTKPGPVTDLRWHQAEELYGPRSICHAQQGMAGHWNVTPRRMHVPVRTQDVPRVQGNNRHPHDSLLQISAPKPVWSLQFCSYKILQFMKQKTSTASQTDRRYLYGLETEKGNEPQVYSSFHRRERQDRKEMNPNFIQMPPCLVECCQASGSSY